MTRELYDFDALSSPRIFLIRALLFLAVFACLMVVLGAALFDIFMSNPLLNGVILGVLIVGIIIILMPIIRLFPEVSWANAYSNAETRYQITREPVLLAPMATLLGSAPENSRLSPETLRTILDSIAMRLEESRELARYLTSLLVFLGLLGTFWGLSLTVGAVSNTIQSLDAGATDLGVVFDNMKEGLSAPLAGMGTAFSSSLLGLAGSLVLGFLALQSAQAQNRFQNELEDWLSTFTTIGSREGVLAGDRLVDISGEGQIYELSRAIERLNTNVQSQSSNRPLVESIAQLAQSMQQVITSMRKEQQMIQEIVENQKRDQSEMRNLVHRVLKEAIGSKSGQSGDGR